LSPTATDIKAQGEMSQANGTLGRLTKNILSLKATNKQLSAKPGVKLYYADV
jgi:hypothetical protein